MNLKIALYSNIWGFEVSNSYELHQIVIASNIQDIWFILHYCPCVFASGILYSRYLLAQNINPCQITMCEFQPEKKYCLSDNRYISTFSIYWSYETSEQVHHIHLLKLHSMYLLVIINFSRTRHTFVVVVVFCFCCFLTAVLFVIIPFKGFCSGFQSKQVGKVSR